MTHLLTVRDARLRKTPPMTQEELAKRSGVDQTYISLVERLLRNPSADIKRRLAKALRISPSKLSFAAPSPAPTVEPASDRVGHEGALAS